MSSNIEITKICAMCGSEFTAKTTKTQYCSHACNSRAYKLRKRDEKVAEVKKEVAAIKIKPITDIKAKDFLSVTDACTLVGVSRWTIWRMIKSDLLNSAKFGRRVIISRKELDALFFPKLDKPKPKEKPITEWYSVEEVMEKYGISRDVVYNHCRSNKIPRKKEGRYSKVSKEHFDALFSTSTNNV